MKRLFSTLIPILLATFILHAQYSLYDFSGGVKLERSGKALTLSKGMSISGSDIFTISEGGWVEIFNPSNSELYKSISPGRFATTRIMIDARQQASNTSKSIHENLRFGRSNPKSKEKVYVEKGMVTRSLEVYDPEAQNLQVDPMKLCEHVVGAIRSRRYINAEKFPVKLTHAATDSAGLKFAIENTLSFPVYFNILKIKETDGHVEISELGQPSGNYVLLRRQAISREQFSGLDPDSDHILIMTHCYFDIDKLVENLETMMKQTTISSPDTNLPVYVQKL